MSIGEDAVVNCSNCVHFFIINNKRQCTYKNKYIDTQDLQNVCTQYKFRPSNERIMLEVFSTTEALKEAILRAYGKMLDTNLVSCLIGYVADIERLLGRTV